MFGFDDAVGYCGGHACFLKEGSRKLEISSCFSENVDLGNRSSGILGKGEKRYRVRKIKFLSLNIPKFSFAGIFRLKECRKHIGTP